MRNKARGTEQAARPRLVLVTPPVEDAGGFAPQLKAACDAGDVAAIILRLAPASDDDQIAKIRNISTALPAEGPAILLDGHVRLLMKTGADGVHLNPEQIETAAPAVLQQGRMVGAGDLQSRHDAMIAGEAGASYVLFGEPDDDGRRPGLTSLIQRISWWSELFVIPSVAYAGDRNEIEPLVRAGADFVALGEEVVWTAPEGPARAIAAAIPHLTPTERTE